MCNQFFYIYWTKLTGAIQLHRSVYFNPIVYADDTTLIAENKKCLPIPISLPNRRVERRWWIWMGGKKCDREIIY